MLETTLFILVVLLIVSWIYVQGKYSYFRDRKILYFKPKFPFGNVGHLRRVQDCNGWCKDLYFKFCGRDILGGMFIGLTPTFIVVDLDVIHDILVRDSSTFPDHVKFTMKKNPQVRLEPSLYSLQGETWRHMRTKLSPVFSHSSMNGFVFDLSMDCASNMYQFILRNAPEDQPINAKDIALRYVCDAVGSCGLGIDCRGTVDENPVLLDIAHQVFNPSWMGIQFYYLIYYYVIDYLPLERWSKPMTAFLKVIDEIVKYREENNLRRNDLMQVFLDIKKNGNLIDDESGECLLKSVHEGLHAEAFSLFWLGYHQITSILAWALFELASNQSVQWKAREEIRMFVGLNGKLDYETVEKMTFLEEIVNETLRKYPAVPFLERVARDDYVTKRGHHLIERGRELLIPVYGIHNDPNIYPDPDRFIPERMSKEKIKSRHPSSFIPFGDGPRLCIAQRFAYLQIKLPIIKLLSHFQLSISSQTKQPIHPRLGVPDDTDIWLNIQAL